MSRLHSLGAGKVCLLLPILLHAPVSFEDSVSCEIHTLGGGGLVFPVRGRIGDLLQSVETRPGEGDVGCESESIRFP